MTEEETEQALELFGKIDTSLERKYEGMGLSLAKGLVEAHGGTLKIDSKTNEGTTVTFVLPVGTRTE